MIPFLTEAAVLCAPFKKRMHDPDAPYDGYDEPDDTEEGTRGARLAKQIGPAGNKG